MKAIILAAGYATRLYPLTMNKAKALLEINGKTILDYIIDKVNEVDQIDEVIIVSNHKFIDQFIKWKENNNCIKKVTIMDDGSTSDENKLGAIGDIRLAINEKNIKEEVMVIAGDNLFTYSLLELYNYFTSINKDCIVASEIGQADELKRMGVVLLDAQSKVIDFEEKPQVPKSNIAIFATYVYTKETLSLFDEYIKQGNNTDAPGHFPEWLYKKKDVYAYTFIGECYDIGTHEAYKMVQSSFRG